MAKQQRSTAATQSSAPPKVNLKALATAFKSYERDIETDLNDEELEVMRVWRKLSRWEKNAAFLLLSSVAHGSLNAKKTDSMPWQKMRDVLGMPKEKSHG